MTPTLKALKIIDTVDIDSATQFARFMWPDSPGWKRFSNAGASGGSRIGQGPKMAAGTFLSKLEKRGLIHTSFVDGRRWYITKEGKDFLDEHSV